MSKAHHLVFTLALIILAIDFLPAQKAFAWGFSPLHVISFAAKSVVKTASSTARAAVDVAGAVRVPVKTAVQAAGLVTGRTSFHQMSGGLGSAVSKMPVAVGKAVNSVAQARKNLADLPVAGTKVALAGVAGKPGQALSNWLTLGAQAGGHWTGY